VSVDNGLGGDGPGPARAGALLREARIRSGRTIEDCASALRSRASQIDALERGDLAVFGGDIYARGFLRSYARLVGVAEQEVLELHGRDPAFDAPIMSTGAPIRQRRGMPGWFVGILAVLGVAGVLASVLVLGGRRAPEPIEAVDPALDGSGPAVTEPDVTAPPAAVPLPPEPVAGPPIDLVLTFEATSWLEVLVDGIVVEPGVLAPAGETLRFVGTETIVLRFGNAGGVRIEANGVDLGAPGRSGQVLRVTFDPDGLVTEGR